MSSHLRFCAPTEVAYTAGPKFAVQQAAMRVEPKKREVRSKGLAQLGHVMGGRSVGAGLTADGAYGAKASGRDYTPRNTSSHYWTMRPHTGVATAYHLGSGAPNGYHLFWRDEIHHKRSDYVVQELDHSILDNLRYVNPYAAPLSPIPCDYDAQKYETGCSPSVQACSKERKNHCH